MTPCRRVPNDQLATLKQHGGRRRRPSGLWSICVSGDRCGDAIGFSLSKGGNATDAGKRKGIGSRGNSCQRKHPAEILALGPSCASTRRSLNANSLGGRNSAGFHTNLCDLAKGYFATTFVSSSSGLSRLNLSAKHVNTAQNHADGRFADLARSVRAELGGETATLARTMGATNSPTCRTFLPQQRTPKPIAQAGTSCPIEFRLIRPQGG